jgi:hypothetical protein
MCLDFYVKAAQRGYPTYSRVSYNSFNRDKKEWRKNKQCKAIVAEYIVMRASDYRWDLDW